MQRQPLHQQTRKQPQATNTRKQKPIRPKTLREGILNLRLERFCELGYCRDDSVRDRLVSWESCNEVCRQFLLQFVLQDRATYRDTPNLDAR